MSIETVQPHADPPRPGILAVAVPPGIDPQRDQMALLVVPPGRLKTSLELQVTCMSVADAGMLLGLRQRLQALKGALVLIPTADEGQTPRVFTLPGCRTCRHGHKEIPAIGSGLVIPGLGKPGDSMPPYCVKHKQQMCPWQYCEWHEDKEPENELPEL